MDFTFSFEQKMIQDSARKIFEKYYQMDDIRNFIESPAIRKEFLNEMAESGFIGIMASEEGGGLGLGAVDALPILIEAGKSLVPFPVIENIIAAKILSELNSGISESFISGEKIATIAWTELEEVQYDRQTLTFSGTCSLVPFAGFADCLIIPLKLVNPDRVPKLQLVLIDLNDKNVSVNEMDNMDLTYPLFSVQIENYQIKDEQLLGSSEDGLPLYSEMKNLGALFLSAEMLGAAEKSLSKSVDYSKERVQFGQQIGKFQALKQLAAESHMKLESIRSATEYAFWAFDQGIDEHSISITKGYTSESALKIIQNAIQMHGGIGFTWENETHFYLKRVLRASHSLGDAYDHFEYIAEKVIG
ncbi:acyl-CoA/acyl-ACP dehydrogenase [Bacillus sp. FJAT-29953]|nr:acyl-CoA/acyl-ACP dehydrogenase [Bacillus sp. FJAT-29953]